jgi:hypothetical protein
MAGYVMLKKYGVVIGLITTLFVGGCVSDRFQNYGGQSIKDVMVDYGPPVNAFDMESGVRAFQWTMNSSYTTPTYINRQRMLLDKEDRNSWTSTNETISGGDYVESSCLYTLFAIWSELRKGWIVSTQRPYRVTCK